MAKKILIVEDNEKNMKLLKDILEYYGYTTFVSGNAEDGIKLANENTPDLIIMDIHLPGISGNEAMKIIKANDKTSNIPSIAVTASIMEHDRQEIMSSGFNGYQEKPIDREKFVTLVKELLETGT
jgi:two-component system cell cycle response regulator DivK